MGAERQTLTSAAALIAMTCVALAVSFTTGCGKKANLASDATQLEKSFGSTPAAAAAPEAQPATTAPQFDTAALAKATAQALREQDYTVAATTLNSLRLQTNLTGDQLRAIHKSYADTYAELVVRAQHGDQKARAALDQLKRWQDRY